MGPFEALKFLDAVLSQESFHASRGTQNKIVQALRTVQSALKGEEVTLDQIEQENADEAK